jgi:hypothetical protein
LACLSFFFRRAVALVLFAAFAWLAAAFRLLRSRRRTGWSYGRSDRWRRDLLRRCNRSLAGHARRFLAFDLRRWRDIGRRNSRVVFLLFAPTAAFVYHRWLGRRSGRHDAGGFLDRRNFGTAATVLVLRTALTLGSGCRCD